VQSAPSLETDYQDAHGQRPQFFRPNRKHAARGTTVRKLR
jgi:hypothetical protein